MKLSTVTIYRGGTFDFPIDFCMDLITMHYTVVFGCIWLLIGVQVAAAAVRTAG